VQSTYLCELQDKRRPQFWRNADAQFDPSDIKVHLDSKDLKRSGSNFRQKEKKPEFFDDHR